MTGEPVGTLVIGLWDGIVVVGDLQVTKNEATRNGMKNIYHIIRCCLICIFSGCTNHVQDVCSSELRFELSQIWRCSIPIKSRPQSEQLLIFRVHVTLHYFDMH